MQLDAQPGTALALAWQGEVVSQAGGGVVTGLLVTAEVVVVWAGWLGVDTGELGVVVVVAWAGEVVVAVAALATPDDILVSRGMLLRGRPSSPKTRDI